jgi:hypothetical protein
MNTEVRKREETDLSVFVSTLLKSTFSLVWEAHNSLDVSVFYMFLFLLGFHKSKVKQSRYTPWRRLRGEDGGEWSASRPLDFHALVKQTIIGLITTYNLLVHLRLQTTCHINRAITNDVNDYTNLLIRINNHKHIEHTLLSFSLQVVRSVFVSVTFLVSRVAQSV